MSDQRDQRDQRDPVEAGPHPGDLEAARGLVGRLALLAAVLRGEAAGDPQAFVDSLAAGLRARLTPGAPALELSLTERGFAVYGADLGLSDLVTAQLSSALWAEGLRSLRLPGGSPDEELVLVGDLLGQDWAGRGGGLEAAAWALQLERLHLEFAPRPTVTPLDGGAVPAEERLARLRGQLGLPPSAAPAGLSAWLEAEPPPAPAVIPLDPAVPVAGPGLVGPAAAQAPPAAAAAVVEVAAARALRGIAAGAPAALDWGRGVAALLDPALGLDPVRADAIGLALERGLGLADGRLEAAVRAGVAVAGAPSPWVGPALTLGALVLRRGGEEGPARALRLGAALPPGAPQQAVADALALALPAPALEGLLRTAGPAELPIALRALRRRMEPTAVVAVSARVSHELPQVREAALLCLREQRGPRLTALMLGALEDPAEAVRLEALRYLTVHRVPEAAAAVLGRLGPATAPAEARALVRAHVVITRGQGVGELVAVAVQGGARGRAALEGLLECGAAGKAAVDQLGRAHPELRADLRALRAEAGPARAGGGQ